MKAPFPAKLCVVGCKALRGRCKALRGQMQSFAWADAKLCVGSCKALRWRLQSFASKMDKTGRKASVLFVIR